METKPWTSNPQLLSLLKFIMVLPGMKRISTLTIKNLTTEKYTHFC